MRRFICSFIVGILFAVGILPLLGTPSNSLGRIPEMQNEKEWYFLNRGWPIPWSGVMLQRSSLSLPFVRVPYMTRMIGDVPMQKMVHIWTVSLLFLALFVVFSLAIYLLFSVSLSQTVVLSVLLIVLDLIIYVKIFPQY